MNQYDKELIKQLGLKIKDNRFIEKIVNFFDSDDEKKTMIDLLKEKEKCSRTDIERMTITVIDKRILEEIKRSRF